VSAGTRVGETTDGRMWDGPKLEANRRTRLLGPGVVGLVLIMIVGTALSAVAPGALAAALAPSPACPASPGWEVDPSGPPPECGGGGGTAPSFVHDPAVTIQSGYRQAWVNWSDTGSTPITPHFTWYPSGGSDLPNPGFRDGSINLNALTAGTTYDFTVQIGNAYGAATFSGSFSTSSAPTTEFVGWVSPISSDSDQLDEIGTESALSGASVWIQADCPAPPDSSPPLPYWAVNFSSTAASSTGSYALSFPESATVHWGLNGIDTTDYSLASTGVCTLESSSPTTQSNSHYSLWADKVGYWNATIYVSSALSATNDYQQFGLPPNGYSISAIGVGFSHTQYGGCTIGITNGAVQRVENYVVTFGYESGYTATGWVNSSTTASAVTDGDSSITYDYHTTGVVNETSGHISFGEAQAFGNGYDLSTDTVSFTDPDSSPPAIGNNSTSSTFERTVGPDSTQWINDSNGGSYQSTAGLNLQIGISGGWDGAGFSGGVSTNLLELVDLTSATSDTSHAVDCSLVNNNPTYAYQFIVTMDGTQAPEAQAINAHIWFEDECTPGTSGCP